MNDTHSDALVFFGATGDLAYKKIFPALQAMVKRGTLNVPVVGVAKAGWNLDQLRARVQDSLEKHGGIDRAAFDKLMRPAALRRWRLQGHRDISIASAANLAPLQRPAHYLAIPPVAVRPGGANSLGNRDVPRERASSSKNRSAPIWPRRGR